MDQIWNGNSEIRTLFFFGVFILLLVRLFPLHCVDSFVESQIVNQEEEEEGARGGGAAWGTRPRPTCHPGTTWADERSG